MKNDDFRVAFTNMDRASLLTADELGHLLGKTKNALYHTLCRNPDSLPTPVFRKNRYLRWRVGDVKDWLNALPQAEGKQAHSVRRGRPRVEKSK